MALTSELFSKPAPDPRLEQCAIRDSAHLNKGVRGEAVARVQKALIALERAKIDEQELRDKLYGPSTARAVLAYKTARGIVNRAYQQSADDIVGKMTIARLDDDMRMLEAANPKKSQYVCVDHEGCKPHDHANCRRKGPGAKGLYAEIEVAPDGTMSHVGTPKNPIGSGEMVSIGGAWEVEYLGFKNFVPDPLQDPHMYHENVLGRKFTHTLRSQSVSDISFRSAPIDRFMRWEILRICKLGARLTYVGTPTAVPSYMRYFSAIGKILETGTIINPPIPGEPHDPKGIRRYAVVSVLRINPWLDDKFLAMALRR